MKLTGVKEPARRPPIGSGMRGSQATAASPGGTQRAILRPAGWLIPGAVALTLLGALALRSDPYAADVPRATVLYIGAEDCAPCRTWSREQWPKFRASTQFEYVEYRAVESPSLLDVLKDEQWPGDLRPYRNEVEAGAGVPMWLLISENDVILKAYGLSQWNDAVLPAIDRLIARRMLHVSARER